MKGLSRLLSRIWDPRRGPHKDPPELIQGYRFNKSDRGKGFDLMWNTLLLGRCCKV
jgi:hypothetical protein